MNSAPLRRRSIHPDEKNIEDQNMFQCTKCLFKFLVSEDGETQTKVTEDDYPEWLDIQKKKENSDINEKVVPTFRCKSCKQAEISQSSGSETVKNILFKGFCISIVFLILGCSCHFLYNQDSVFYHTRQMDIPVKSTINSVADDMLEKELFRLEDLYNKQIEDTWITLTSGIKSVMRESPSQPSMFLMLYDSELAGKTAQCIAQDVSKPAIRYLLNKSDTPKVVNGADLNNKYLLDDPGLLLKQINGTVREKGALVVTNLHKVPPAIAKMFHFVCDKYSPLVEKAVTFFTMKVNKVPYQKDQEEVAQQTMRELWSSELDDNILNPLITRMTSNIIRIYPDSSCSK